MVSLSSIGRLLWMGTLLFGLNACFATGEVAPNGDLSDATDAADATDATDAADATDGSDSNGSNRCDRFHRCQ